jgi:hypothetical protein
VKKVLIIACYFPPAGGGGVQRTSKFVKYLPNFGWTPIVLTTKKQILPFKDVTLLNDLPSNVKIVRTLSLEPKTPIKLNLMNHILYWVSIPDLSIWWWFRCKKSEYFTKPVKNITNRIFICHKQINNDTKSNSYSLKRQ